MKRKERDELVARAAEYLQARRIGRRSYLYAVDELGVSYVVTSDGLAALGARLAVGQADAYSLWCGYDDSGRAARPDDLTRPTFGG